MREAPEPFIGEDPSAGRREQTVLHYRLAAILFVGGGLGAIGPDLLHDPPYPATIYLLPLLALVTGGVVWAISTRLPHRYLHVVAIVATLEVALTVALADQLFSTYYTFIAIFAAYVFHSRRAIAGHIAFATLCAFAPTLYDPDMVREGLLQGLILAPTLVLAGGAVAFLRERLAASEDRYRDLSERDPLTGVGNYRMLSLRLSRELSRHKRFAHPLALFVIDLDDFKRVNDNFGHQRGDSVLQEVGRAISNCVRSHDVVVRQGGDEFAVVAPETDRADASQLAERLQESLAEVIAGETPVGASIGYAWFPDDADTLEGLVAAAGARLRQVKRERRGPAEVERAGLRHAGESTTSAD